MDDRERSEIIAGRRAGKSWTTALMRSEALIDYMYNVVIAERLGYKDVEMDPLPDGTVVISGRREVDGKEEEVKLWTLSVDHALTLLDKGDVFVLRVDAVGVWTAVINGQHKGTATSPALAICKAWESK